MIFTLDSGGPSMRRAIAFVKKDFQLFCSYKLSFLMHWLGIPATILTFFFLAKFIDIGRITFPDGYSGGYFPFVLLGLMVSGYLRSSLGCFSQRLCQEQTTGTLEAILATCIKPSTMIICMSLWDFILASINAIVILLTGILFFGVRFPQANAGAVVIVWFLTTLAFSAIGILSAAFVIVFKEGNPLAWLVTSFSILLGGVYFPVSIFPRQLQLVSSFLPVTYSIRALRNSLLKGETLFQLSADLFILFLFALILLPFSMLIFNLAVNKAKKDGSLGCY